VIRVANHGLVVAALAAGGIAGIAAALLFEVHWLRQQLRPRLRRERSVDAERKRRIDSAVDGVLDQVEDHRRASTDENGEAGSPVEVRAKAHLRLLARKPPSNCDARQQDRQARRSGSARHQ
jgi:hypothetical protein